MTYIDKLATLRPWSGDAEDEAETLNQLEICWSEITEVLRAAEAASIAWKRGWDYSGSPGYEPDHKAIRYLGMALERLREKVEG